METKVYNTLDYQKIVDDLLNGEVVGFPTETVYGLAIVFDNKEAFDKLYEIKNRSINKPISMMVADVSVFVTHKEAEMLPGGHAGLTKEEMEIPLIAVVK